MAAARNASKSFEAVSGPAREQYAQSSDSKVQFRMQCVQMVLAGCAKAQLAEWTGISPRTLERWMKSFRRDGIVGLSDSPRSGRTSVLSTEQYRRLRRDLAVPPKKLGYDADVWTGLLVTSVIFDRFGITLSLRQGQRLLKKYKAAEQRQPVPGDVPKPPKEGS